MLAIPNNDRLMIVRRRRKSPESPSCNSVRSRSGSMPRSCFIDAVRRRFNVWLLSFLRASLYVENEAEHDAFEADRDLYSGLIPVMVQGQRPLDRSPNRKKTALTAPAGSPSNLGHLWKATLRHFGRGPKRPARRMATRPVNLPLSVSVSRDRCFRSRTKKSFGGSRQNGLLITPVLQCASVRDAATRPHRPISN